MRPVVVFNGHSIRLVLYDELTAQGFEGEVSPERALSLAIDLLTAASHKMAHERRALSASEPGGGAAPEERPRTPVP
jgi:hypothetical protein